MKEDDTNLDQTLVECVVLLTLGTLVIGTWIQ